MKLGARMVQLSDSSLDLPTYAQEMVYDYHTEHEYLSDTGHSHNNTHRYTNRRIRIQAQIKSSVKRNPNNKTINSMICHKYTDTWALGWTCLVEIDT